MRQHHFAGMPAFVGIVLAIIPTFSLRLPAADPPQKADAGSPVVSWNNEFANPPGTWRPQPLFVYNGIVKKARITEMLEQFAARGMGGVFVHPRPGLITEYLSPEWFEMWGHTLAECKRLGLECNIYDENSYPSGFAGGHVPAQSPQLALRALNCVKLTTPGLLPEGEVMGIFVGNEAGGRPVRFGREAIRNASVKTPVYVAVLQTEPPRGMTAWFPFVDLTRPETTKLFLKLTHDQYYQHFKESFGKEIKYSFTDEPHLSPKPRPVLSKFLLAEFQQEHGYSLLDKLDAFCFGGEEGPAVRFDYFTTVNRLWTDNFLKTYAQWCKEHGIAFTGHFYEHEWPSLYRQPTNMYSYRWQHVPGNDLLAFQFKQTALADNAMAYLNLKELSSVANQVGQKRVLVETCGGGGYDMTLRDFKALEDFAMVNGVNIIDPHLCYQTLAGVRKYDWPQTISDHAPWWDAYKLQTDHVGRTLVALSQGREKNRVLVLHPDTTAWLHMAPGDPDAKEIDAIRKSQQGLLLALAAKQVDYDLGDEFTMADLGSVEKGTLKIGQGAYRAVIVPPSMENWNKTTLARISDYLASGGQVFAMAGSPKFVSGRPSNDPAELIKRNEAGGWRVLPSVEALVDAVRGFVKPRLCADNGGPLAPSLVWRRHELGNGQVVYFFCHPWKSAYREEISIEGQSIIALDTRTGQMRPIPSTIRGDHQAALLEMPALGHAIWLCKPERGEPVPHAPPEPTKVVDLVAGPIRRTSPNHLLIDYCDLDAGIVKAQGIATVNADPMNWRAQGFEGNLWQGSSQHRRAFIDAVPRTNSGFTVDYHFTIEESAPAAVHDSLEIAVERPWLYRITLNGQAMDFTGAKTWYDEEMRKVSIAKLAKAGENTLRMEARPFKTLCEIMPVHVLGEFSLKPVEKGFAIAAPAALKPGRWDEQGIPFYSRSVRYEYTFDGDGPARILRVQLGDWSGSVARVLLDGEDLGFIAYPPDALQVSRAIAAGRHTLAVEVAGNLKNTWGPHFAEGLPLLVNWQRAPATTPPGQKYRFYPTGLNSPPTVELTK